LYKVTNKSKLDFGENLLKMIMRVKKMKDAKSQIQKIVSLIFTRIHKIKWVRDELAKLCEDDN